MSNDAKRQIGVLGAILAEFGCQILVVAVKKPIKISLIMDLS